MTLEEFKINEHLSLKLINGKTEIYVDSEIFITCKKLIINIDTSDIERFDDMISIDEIIKETGVSDEFQYFIPPHVEFWGHCSNLQTWVENGYNPSLLHSSLAFPLLRRLTDIGDNLARNVFREEILKRFESGVRNIVLPLLENDYLQYFSQEELLYIYENFVIPLEPSSLLLDFLRYLSIHKILPAREYYERLVKKLMLEGSYKERRKVVNRHIDILTKGELFSYFNHVLQENNIEEERFRLLDILTNELEFHGEIFDNTRIVNNLLRRDEQNYFLSILNNSKYLYIREDFEADEVRRRAWQEKLYYDLFKGHVVSIELLCEDNHKEFLDNMKKLEKFPKLENLNILFSRTSDYESLRYDLPLHLDNVKIYVFDHSFPYLSQIRLHFRT